MIGLFRNIVFILHEIEVVRFIRKQSVNAIDKSHISASNKISAHESLQSCLKCMLSVIDC